MCRKQVENIVLYIICCILVFLLSVTIYTYNKPVIQRPTATTVGYRTLIKKTDSTSIYRNCEYRLKIVTYDTIHNRELSTIETPRVIELKVNPDDSILEDAGIMWDNKRECFIQRFKQGSK